MACYRDSFNFICNKLISEPMRTQSHKEQLRNITRCNAFFELWPSVHLVLLPIQRCRRIFLKPYEFNFFNYSCSRMKSLAYILPTSMALFLDPTGTAKWGVGGFRFDRRWPFMHFINGWVRLLKVKNHYTVLYNVLDFRSSCVLSCDIMTDMNINVQCWIKPSLILIVNNE
jgi:hypothetical protein